MKTSAAAGPIRAVFFDLDDTLCDAKAAFAQALQVALHVVRDRYTHLTSEQVVSAWRTVHIPLFADLAAGRLSMTEVRSQRFRRLLTELGISADDAFADEVDLRLGLTQLDLLMLFEDVSVLEELRERRGLHVGILTNGAGDAHPDSQRSKANRLGLIERVDSFLVSDEIGYRKPDPRAFLPSLRAAGCEPRQALYVGDSLENDIAGANRAGMTSILLWRPGGGLPIPQTTADTQPHHTVASLAEVSRLVREIETLIGEGN